MSGQHSGHGHEHHAGHHHGHGHSGQAAALAEANLVTDPVCGMKVDPATSKHRLEHGGRTFHFCSAGCQAKFTADPGKYLKPREAVPPTAPQQGVIYTCPMHPEIR